MVHLVLRPIAHSGPLDDPRTPQKQGRKAGSFIPSMVISRHGVPSGHLWVIVLVVVPCLANATRLHCLKSSHESPFLLQTKIGAGRLMGPKGVAVDRNGHIIVVDNKACCVFIFQSNGKFVTKFGSRGTSERQFAGTLDGNTRTGSLSYCMALACAGSRLRPGW